MSGVLSNSRVLDNEVSSLFKCGTLSPPMSTSYPPGVIHMTSVPYFHHSSTFVYYTKHRWKNKKLGRPGNEASSVQQIAHMTQLTLHSPSLFITQEVEADVYVTLLKVAAQEHTVNREIFVVEKFL